MADGTYIPKVYRKSGGDELVVASGGKITVESGGTLQLDAGATASLADEILAAADIALADGKILVGNAGGAATAVTPSGDVTITNAGVTAIGAKKVAATMIALANGKVLIGDAGGASAEQSLSGDVTVTNAGVTAIGAGKVTSAMLASGAGVAALLTAGLGGSASYLKTQNATADLLAANGTKDRACLVVVVVDETFADAGGNQPTFTVGEEATLNKFFDTAAFTNKTAGTVLVAAGTNIATKKVQVTGVQAVGAGTGGITVTVLAIPTT